jgi:hypothetical protein
MQTFCPARGRALVDVLSHRLYPMPLLKVEPKRIVANNDILPAKLNDCPNLFCEDVSDLIAHSQVHI